MNLSGIVKSEFNSLPNRKHIFLTPEPESLKKVQNHWGQYRPPIVAGRIIINTKKYFEMDKPLELHLRIVKYTVYEEGQKKYTNFKLAY